VTSYVGLLRAVNVGGRKPVAMAALRAWLAGLGFEEPRTLLQSGNVVFRGRRLTGARLERLLETEAAKTLGVETDFLVRTAEEWAGVIARNPFTAEAARDPAHLATVFLKDAPSAAQVAALRAAIVGREVVRASGREAFIVYPDGMGRSKLTLPLIERKLGSRGTARNWNTVLKLAALV
jgi:uncharacterized protein (DUF1697 family)